MALRRLLPAFRRSYSSGSSDGFIKQRHALRSIQDPINEFHVSPAFTSNLATVTELPGLSRHILSPPMFRHADKQSHVQKTRVMVYADEVMATFSEKLSENISRCAQRSDNGSLLSTMRYACDLANAVLSALPSAQVAITEQSVKQFFSGMNHLTRYEIRGVLFRHELQTNAKDISSFTLRAVAGVDNKNSKVGPKASFPGNLSRLILEMHLRPIALHSVTPSGGLADEPTQDVEDFVRELLGGLWRSLDGCQFTSFVAWNEAVVKHLKDSFSRSKFNQYVELESMRVVSHLGVMSGPPFLQWVHEPPHLKESTYGYFLGKGPESKMLKLLHKRSPEAVGTGAVPMSVPPNLPVREDKLSLARAHAHKESRDTVKIAAYPHTLDISVASDAQMTLTASTIASRFEPILAQSISIDFPSVLDGFLNVLQSLPPNITDPLTVTISRDSPTSSTSRASRSPRPTHQMELKKGTPSDSVKVAMRADLQRLFQLRFRSGKWSHRRIEVKGVLFQLSAVDAAAVNSLRSVPRSEQVTIEQEMDNLITNTVTIVKKVCGGVRFDDVTTVTGYLAEAVLRVVRPLTAGFVLESVSMDVVIGDDPVTLTKTVSVADLEARVRALESHISPIDHVELPSGYQSTVSMQHDNLSGENIAKTGFTNLTMQLLLNPAADYEPISVNSKAVDAFEHGLEASPNVNCYSLKSIVCNVLKTLHNGDGLVVQLSVPPSPLPHNLTAPSPCHRITVFSDGEIICMLEPFTHISLMYVNAQECKRVRALVQISLRGTPNQHASGRINALQQMTLMHEVLAPKLTAVFDGYVCHQLQDAANKVAEMVLEARSELQDHIDIHTVLSHCSTWSIGQTHTESAKQHDIPTVSASSSASKDAVAIKSLLQELDSKLLSITSTSTDGAIASDEITRPTQLDSKKLDSKANSRSQMQRGVVVALGSNVGNRVEEIEKACRAIDADPDMRIVDTSFLYETKPMYVEDQGRFVNGACEIETSLTPIELLDRLQAIEQGHGRVKLVDKGPRNIDLDIAIFRDEIVETERLTIPHLLMHEREFVLRPIMDLSSMRDWTNPRSTKSLCMMFSEIIKPRFVDKNSTEPMRVVTPLTTGAMMYPMDPCRKTLVMSILNTTPDSFSDGESNTLDPLSLRETAAAHIAAGATIIDVGGQSSRPNAPDVTAEEEISRVLPAIAAIKSLPEAEGIAISIDTYRAAVAEAAVNAGAHIVNDISAGALDPHMLSTVARLGCTYIMMHMRGSPATMQSPENCTYGQLHREIIDELNDRVALAIKAGVRKWRIVLDQGIGFAKTQDQNLELLRTPLVRRNSRGFLKPNGPARNLSRMPHLVGCSRKGFIGNITGVTEPKDRIFGTAAAVTASIRTGADIVRVHDVQEMAQAAKMADGIYRVKSNSC